MAARRDVPWGRLRGVQLLRDKDRHVGRGENRHKGKKRIGGGYVGEIWNRAPMLRGILRVNLILGVRL